MYNKYTMEHKYNPVEDLLDLKHSWEELKFDVFNSDTMEEVEGLLVGTPLYSVWSILIRRSPLLQFDSMWNIAMRFKNEVFQAIEELEEICY